jgi:hypothetical protein
MSTSTHPTATTAPHRSTLRNLLVAVCIAFASLVAFGAVAPAASASVNLGNDWALANGSYSCSSRTVQILPTASGALNGNYTVYAYAQVYDYNYGKWISEPWRVVDGITTHFFYGITNPYAYAYVNYAKIVNGKWMYKSEWITLSDDLDNSNTFCNTPGW